MDRTLTSRFISNLMAADDMGMVPVEEFNRLKRKLAEKSRKDQKKLRQLDTLKTLVANGMQIRQEKPIRTKIALALPNFVELSANQKCFRISSDPMELVGFKWRLEAWRLDEMWMGLTFSVHAPQHYKGDFKFEVDCSFRLLNTSTLSKDIRKDVGIIQLEKHNLLIDDAGFDYHIDRIAGLQISKFAEIQDLRDPNNGFLSFCMMVKASGWRRSSLFEQPYWTIWTTRKKTVVKRRKAAMPIKRISKKQKLFLCICFIPSVGNDLI